MRCRIDEKQAEDWRKLAFRALFLGKGKRIMGKEAFRLREKQLKIRVTEYEYQLIQERMEASGAVTLQDYLLQAAINGYLIKVDYSDIKDLAYEINRIGNNINQIAHKINAENVIYKTDIEEVQDKIDLIWKMLRAKFYQIP